MRCRRETWWVEQAQTPSSNADTIIATVFCDVRDLGNGSHLQWPRHRRLRQRIHSVFLTQHEGRQRGMVGFSEQVRLSSVRGASDGRWQSPLQLMQRVL